MSKQTRIYYAKPSITEMEVRYITDAAANGWGERCYDYITRFENNFCAYAGTQHAVATSSGTGALHLGLAALGISHGDEVILADVNWIASVAPVVHLGAKPVFVDILPDTWCIDPAKVEAAITSRTKAIIAVHLYGNLCNMDKLEDIAKRHNLYLIEDAAEAIGSHWNGRRAGSRGIFGIFSFHGTKTITTGEGGMLVTQNEALYEHVLQLNNHGRKRGDTRQFWAVEAGYKFKMSNMQAALGCAQMERIEELTDRKREIFFTYRQLLAECESVAMNPVPSAHNALENSVYGYWMPALVFSGTSGIEQPQVLRAFADANIDGRAFFAPLSAQANFPSCTHNVLSADICRRAVNLPSYHEISSEGIDRVCTVIKSLLSGNEVR